MVQAPQSRKRYPSALTDEPWTWGEPRLPPAKPRQRGGRPRPVERRAVLNTLRSLPRSGWQWARLPHELLPKSPPSDSLAQWRDDGPWDKIGTAGREQTRVAAGRAPPPSALCIASQSVKTPEVGGPERGDDGGQSVKGRKRHRLGDTLGLLIAVLSTSAGLEAGSAAPPGLALIAVTAFPRRETTLGDTKDHHHALHAWMATPRPPWRLEVTTRPEGSTSLTPLRQRWVVERTQAWKGRDRRNTKDYERQPTASAVMSQLRDIHLRLHRLSPPSYPAFRSRQKAAGKLHNEAVRFPDSLGEQTITLQLDGIEDCPDPPNFLGQIDRALQEHHQINIALYPLSAPCTRAIEHKTFQPLGIERLEESPAFLYRWIVAMHRMASRSTVLRLSTLPP